MLIPKKRKGRIFAPTKMVVTLLTVTLLVIGWQKLSSFSNQTIVSYDDLIIATVEKGDLIREVRAPGTLVPVELNYLSATSNGRVKEILLEAGDTVEAGTLIMTFDNPELSQAVDAANYELELQQASYLALEQRLRQESLTQQIKVADFKSRFEIAKQRRQANKRLLKTGAVSDLAYKESILFEQQLNIQHQLEIERLESLPALDHSVLAVALAKIKKAKRQLALQHELVNGLSIKATAPGILQEVLLEEGQQVMTGTLLARIAGQNNLKAELRVQESQVKEVTKGQSVVISASGKIAKGVVKRINPAVQQGVVIVDVYFTDTMLEGARPDLRINGIIELQKMNNILKLRRPIFSQEYATSSVFVLNQDQTKATRKQVDFGRGSVDMIEILSTLNMGDRVVVSSTNDYNQLTEISLRDANQYQ